MEKTIVVIDGNSLINRAYYAMQRPMITKDGIYTQGVYGFLNMLAKIRRDYEPGYIAVAFDLKSPTFRHKEYAEYKAGRKKMPLELAMQMPILKDVLTAMNIKILELEGFEADDIIGTIAVNAEEAGLEPLIITGDKDELQLATQKTKVIITKKGISEFEIYDHQAMVDKYGFTPTQFIDYKGLMGDQSDNIPGIPGVGPKTAQKLIVQYGSIEKLLENTDELPKSKMKENIEANVQQAVMSKRLATINTNTPIEIDFDEYLCEEPDYDKLIEVYKKLEFNSFLKKLDSSKFAGTDSEDTPDIEKLEISKTIIKDSDSVGYLKEAVKASAESGEPVIIKVFGNNDHKLEMQIDGICVMVNHTKNFVNNQPQTQNHAYFYCDCADQSVLQAVIDIFNEYRPGFAGHDIKNDYFALMSFGFDNCTTNFDTAIGQYVLDSGRSNYDIKTLAFEYFHYNIDSEKDFFKENGQQDMFSDLADSYADYGLSWCRVVHGLVDIISQKLKENDLEEVYFKVELPLIEVLASMEFEGFTANEGTLRELGSMMTVKLEEISKNIYELAGEEFNINSPVQLGVILFEKLELPAGKKTKRGYSTSAEVLEKLRDKHSIIPLILEYRTLSKLNSTYIEGLTPLIAKDRRIRAHFQQTVTATGRISCTEPNLQNIPIRQDLGRQIRKAFVPTSSEYTLVGADYSQIELRVLAHMAADPTLIDAFNRGEDIHRLTAARVLGIPEDEITPLQRSKAKAVNFGVIYGMSSFGLSTELHITRKDADAYIKEYFNKYTDVKKFMDEQVAYCKANGYVETIMGRKRYVKEITASNYMVRQLGERLAMNSPIQGSAADIIKIAMILVYRELKKQGLKSKLILQVHDELIIETFKEEKAIVEKLLRENMENAMDLNVKLSVDLNSGDTWYDLK